jgi:mono/diheme cytochrome c family protein
MRTTLNILTAAAVVIFVLPERAHTSSRHSGTIEARPAPAAYTDDAFRTRAEAGRRLFLRENCYGCHGGRAGGAMCPNLRGIDATDEEIIETIHEGTEEGMPAFGRLLSDAQIRDLLAYIRSLRTPAEPTFTIWWR